MIDSVTRPFRGKTVDTLYQYQYFLDHFIMFIFAKAAMMQVGTASAIKLSLRAVGFVLWREWLPSRPNSQTDLGSLMMVIFHFGIGFGAIMAGIQSIGQLITALA